MPLMWSNLIYDLDTVVTGLRNAVYSLENVTHGITHGRYIHLVYMVTAFAHALGIDVHITVQSVHLAVLLVCLGVQYHVTKVSGYGSTLVRDKLATNAVIANLVFVCRCTHLAELESFHFVCSPCLFNSAFLSC